MASFLNELSLAIGLLGSDHSAIADADGWKDYVWKIQPVERCIQIDNQGLCLASRDRWDWKRDQLYEFSYRLNGTSITTRLRLINKDANDKDHVCITAIFADSRGDEVAVFHQNWMSLPGRTIDRQVPIRPAVGTNKISQLVIGSKQCRGGAHEDDGIFLKKRTGLRQR